MTTVESALFEDIEARLVGWDGRTFIRAVARGGLVEHTLEVIPNNHRCVSLMIWVGELIVTVIEVVNATEMFRALMGDVRPARLYAELADPDGFGQVLEFLDSWARKWG